MKTEFSTLLELGNNIYYGDNGALAVGIVHDITYSVSNKEVTYNVYFHKKGHEFIPEVTLLEDPRYSFKPKDAMDKLLKDVNSGTL